MAVFGMIKGVPSGGYTGYSLVYENIGSSSYSVPVENGKKYLCLAYGWSSGSLSPTTFDGIASNVTGGTAKTKIANLTTSNANAAGTVFEVDATSTSLGFSSSGGFGIKVFTTD